jgi:uncharacterized protein (UPF0332 family)
VSGSWRQVAVDALKAGGELCDLGRYRSSVSRSYYAAYSALAARLSEAGISFANEREGPGHEQLTDLIENNLPGRKTWQRRELKKLVRMLYGVRLQADYSPQAAVGRAEAQRSLKFAALTLNLLEVSDG